MRPSYYYLLLSLLCSISAFGQFTLTPIAKEISSRQKSSSREQEEKPKKLPFWDDFSFANGPSPVDSLWQYGRSVWVNDGMAINPPSIGVATFDGLDSLGQPYNVNDVLAKGFADHLISQPVQMDLIDPALRSNLSITFYYQLKGRGELPDAGDLLRLLLLNKDGVWEPIWSVENDNSLQTDQFYEVVIPIPTDNDRFFHEKFRFKFQNFARLSGPYDTWNLDYVFIGNGNVSNDPPPFPDRTLVYRLTSIFADYSSVPIKHFLSNPSAALTNGSFTINNRRADQTPEQGGQPVNYVSDAIVSSRKDNVITNEIVNINNNNPSEGTPVLYNTNKTISLNTTPLLDKFDSGADSISIRIKLNLTSGDNVVKVLLPEPEGDYVPLIYSPIDFRLNDSTSSTFTLANFYAYDDGTAEYGAGIKGFGVQLMYRFDMKTVDPDTLVGVRIYFPRFGDESSQLIQLQVFKDLDGTGASTLHQESVTVKRSEKNQFVDYVFSRFVGVQGTFYIGWKQNTSAAISVGLDKNTDSNNKIYFNISGSEWQQDQNTIGSLMIRPVFGKGGFIVGLPENDLVKRAYPNPTNGVLYLSPLAEQIRVIDVTGREINYQSEHSNEYQRLDLGTVPSGIYIVQYLVKQNIRTEKIILQR